MNKELIFRDDDISVLTPVESFAFVHDIFKRYKVKHTIAVIAKDIEKNTRLCEYINANKDLIDIQLHCWEHIDHSEASAEDLALMYSKALVTLKGAFDVVPTIHFPPWNLSNSLVVEIAAKFNLAVSTQKASLSNYIKNKGSIPFDVLNFHYWYEPEVNDLYEALAIYRKLNPLP